MIESYELEELQYHIPRILKNIFGQEIIIEKKVRHIPSKGCVDTRYSVRDCYYKDFDRIDFEELDRRFFGCFLRMVDDEFKNLCKYEIKITYKPHRRFIGILNSITCEMQDAEFFLPWIKPENVEYGDYKDVYTLADLSEHDEIALHPDWLTSRIKYIKQMSRYCDFAPILKYPKDNFLFNYDQTATRVDTYDEAGFKVYDYGGIKIYEPKKEQ